MNKPTWMTRLALAGVSCAMLLAGSARADDPVTVPKSRLEELLRKEAELEKLKGQTPAAPAAPATGVKPGPTVETAAPAPRVEPPPARVVPPVASLPALTQDEVVEAQDLAGHYAADPKLADQRYAKLRFKVRGEIVSFGQPLLSRNYTLILKTDDRNVRVQCQVMTPDQFKAAYPSSNGMELVATSERARAVLAKVGQVVVLHGQCGGLKDGIVRMKGCRLETAKP